MRTVEIPLGEELILVIDTHKWTVRLTMLDLEGPGVKPDYIADSREAISFEEYLRRNREITLKLTFNVADGVIHDNTVEGEVTKVDGKALLQ